MVESYSYRNLSGQSHGGAQRGQRIDEAYRPIAEILRGHFAGAGKREGRSADLALHFEGLSHEQRARVEQAIQQRLSVDGVFSTIGGNAAKDAVSITSIDQGGRQQLYLGADGMAAARDIPSWIAQELK